MSIYNFSVQTSAECFRPIPSLTSTLSPNIALLPDNPKLTPSRLYDKHKRKHFVLKMEKWEQKKHKCWSFVLKMKVLV